MEMIKAQFMAFVKWLDNHGEKFHTNPQEQRKTNILIRASVLAGVFMLLYIGNCIFIDFTLGLYILPIESAIFFSLPFWIKAGIRPKIIAHIFILNGTAFGVLMVVFSGGLQSPVTPWLTLMPICAILFMDTKNAFIWAFIILGVVMSMGLYWIVAGPLPADYNKENDGLFFLNCYAGLIFIYLFLSLIFEKRLNATISELEDNKVSLELANNQLSSSILNLKETQALLIQSEKMASLGELTAGIAHEIQNPLNFVNNFSEISTELIDDILEVRSKSVQNKDETGKVSGDYDMEQEEQILNSIKKNLEKINHHGKRADAIVKGMLQHSRPNSGTKLLTDINGLCDEYLRLAYQNIQAKDSSFKATLHTYLNPNLPEIKVISQDISRVILNIVNNACYAVNEKSKVESKKPTTDYKPTVSISTKRVGDTIEISIKDNGNGIPAHIKDKIFQPFFTTKPTGQGTGLGLSLAYDIVTKGHGGELTVESTKDEGTEFSIHLSIVQ